MFCECGCGKETKEGNRYINGHNQKGKTYEEIYGERANQEINKRSEAQKDHVGYGKGKTWVELYGIDEAKRKSKISSNSLKGKKAWNKGLSKETNSGVKKISEKLMGNTHTVGRHREQSKEERDKRREKLVGRSKSELHRKHMKEAQNRPEVKEKKSQSLKGERNGMFGKKEEESPNWRGGISKLPYSFIFDSNLKERIRDKFNRRCVLCNKPESELKRKLFVHHINYNKEDCYEENLIPLCNSCSTKVNFNRDQWEIGFKIFTGGSQQKERIL